MSNLGTGIERYDAPPLDRFRRYAIDWKKFLERPIFCSPHWSCKAYLDGRTVLITGAGGSIGSALAAGLRGEAPTRLILLDRSARRLQTLRLGWEENSANGSRINFIEADILDKSALQDLFERFQPEVVFHTAALKHLPRLESEPFAALENNVLGTLHLLQLADYFQAEYFVNISTDKAVMPTSILGVSKRITELLLMAMKPSGTRRLSVRLGNVLESSGSVVPIFVQAIKDHRPLTISDPHATRYFVTLKEAAALLIESLRIADSAPLLPEMGRPHRIVDLATFVMKALHVSNDCGRRLRFFGLRDGEKCSEQLAYEYERLEATATRKIYRIAGNCLSDPAGFADKVTRLLGLVTLRRKSGFIKALMDVVPEFEPSRTVLRHVR